MLSINLNSKLKLLLGSLLVVSFFSLGLNSAFAVGNAYFPQATTLLLTGTGFSYTIIAGSDADSVVVSTNSFTITISSGQSFTITSTDLHSFIGSSFTTTCNAAKSLTTLSISGLSSSQTFTITPTQNALCNASAGGGGGGGGSYTPTLTPTPTPTVTVTPTPTLTPTPTVTYAPTPIPGPITAPPTAHTNKLYRKASDPKIYVLGADGKLTWVKTLEEFNAAGYNWSDVKVISGPEFAKLGVKSSLGLKLGLKKGVKWLNIRKSGSTKGAIIGKMIPADMYEKTGQSGAWFKINFNGQDGWIHSGYTVGK